MEPEPADGVYVLRVSLGKVSRTLELTSEQTLPMLASTILEAFHWDSDHLFEFVFGDRARDERFVLCAGEDASGLFEDGTAGSDQVAVGSVGLRARDTFFFRFDFGDDHWFSINVVEVRDQRTPRTRYPRVTGKTGSAPKQYPQW